MSTRDHAWAYADDFCEVCGITKEAWLNESEWNALFCPGNKNGNSPKQTCCKTPIPIYLGGAWFCETCGKPDFTMKSPDIFSSPSIQKGRFEIQERKCICTIEQLMHSGCKCNGK